MAILRGISIAAIKKTVILAIVLSLVGWLAFQFRTPSVQAADIAGGISATIAIIIGFLVLYPRLDYLLLPGGTRKAHRQLLQHVILLASKATVAMSGSRGHAGVRSEALATLYLTSKALPHVPPGGLDRHLDIPEEIQAELDRCKLAAEEAIKAGGLESTRFIYQTNLFNALGELIKATAYELGGHGYVTEHWERNLVEWNMCAVRLYHGLRSPLGPPIHEDQLLRLLDRLSSVDDGDYITERLKNGNLVRLKQDDGEWTGTLKLTSDPKLVDHLETGMPVWELSIVDRNGSKAEFTCDATGFEPAPGE